jgi:hypothetical protein
MGVMLAKCFVKWIVCTKNVGGLNSQQLSSQISWTTPHLRVIDGVTSGGIEGAYRTTHDGGTEFRTITIAALNALTRTHGPLPDDFDSRPLTLAESLDLLKRERNSLVHYDQHYDDLHGYAHLRSTGLNVLHPWCSRFDARVRARLHYLFEQANGVNGVDACRYKANVPMTWRPDGDEPTNEEPTSEPEATSLLADNEMLATRDESLRKQRESGPNHYANAQYDQRHGIPYNVDAGERALANDLMTDEGFTPLPLGQPTTGNCGRLCNGEVLDHTKEDDGIHQPMGDRKAGQDQVDKITKKRKMDEEWEEWSTNAVDASNTSTRRGDGHVATGTAASLESEQGFGRERELEVEFPASGGACHHVLRSLVDLVDAMHRL